MNKATRLALLGLGFAALAFVGCPQATEEKGFPVSGKVVENGAALKPPAGNLPPGVKGVDVQFYALDASNLPGELYNAEVADDGTFKVIGKGKGLPAGKYRVVVVAAASGTPVPGGAAPSGGPPGVPPGAGGRQPVVYSGSLANLPDRFKGAFGPENSPLVVQIDGPATLAVDVVTKKVTKE